MTRNGVDLLVQKYLNEPGFKARMQQDPEGAVKSAGISLSADEWATVRNIVLTTSDEALQARISKAPLN